MRVREHLSITSFVWFSKQNAHAAFKIIWSLEQLYHRNGFSVVDMSVRIIQNLRKERGQHPQQKLMKRILHLFPGKFLFQYREKPFVGLSTRTWLRRIKFQGGKVSPFFAFYNRIIHPSWNRKDRRGFVQEEGMQARSTRSQRQEWYLGEEYLLV